MERERLSHGIRPSAPLSLSFNVMTAVNSALTAAETISHTARPCLVVSRLAFVNLLYAALLSHKLQLRHLLISSNLAQRKLSNLKLRFAYY